MPSKTSLFRSLALTAVAAGLMAVPMMASAQTAMPPATMTMMMAPAPTTLSLSASGEVSAAPDKATINFAVVSQGKTASDAMKANNIRMNAVMASLKSAGIADKDIQTSSLNLSPQYDYTDGQHPRLTGYQAQNQITVRINDLSQTGPVIDTVIKAGINQIDSINFGLKNDDALKDQARQSAVKTLMARAELYAQATGMHVKRILTLSESDQSYQPPQPMMFARAEKSADASTPVAAGELQLSVQVSATFELEK